MHDKVIDATEKLKKKKISIIKYHMYKKSFNLVFMRE